MPHNAAPAQNTPSIVADVWCLVLTPVLIESFALTLFVPGIVRLMDEVVVLQAAELYYSLLAVLALAVSFFVDWGAWITLKQVLARSAIFRGGWVFICAMTMAQYWGGGGVIPFTLATVLPLLYAHVHPRMPHVVALHAMLFFIFALRNAVAFGGAGGVIDNAHPMARAVYVEASYAALVPVGSFLWLLFAAAMVFHSLWMQMLCDGAGPARPCLHGAWRYLLGMHDRDVVTGVVVHPEHSPEHGEPRAKKDPAAIKIQPYEHPEIAVPTGTPLAPLFGGNGFWSLWFLDVPLFAAASRAMLVLVIALVVPASSRPSMLTRGAAGATDSVVHWGDQGCMFMQIVLMGACVSTFTAWTMQQGAISPKCSLRQLLMICITAGATGVLVTLVEQIVFVSMVWTAWVCVDVYWYQFTDKKKKAN